MHLAMHKSVLDVLGMEIIDGTHPAGMVLTLSGIQARFGISRTVARECMRLLELVDMVTSKRHIGIVIRPRLEWDVLDARVIKWRLAGPDRLEQLHSLTELRAAVEPIAAACAAQRATTDDRDRLCAIAARLHAAKDDAAGADRTTLEREFHITLLRMSHNELFIALTDVVVALLAEQNFAKVRSGAPGGATDDLNILIADAVQRHDRNAAERTMRLLLAPPCSSGLATPAIGLRGSPSLRSFRPRE